LSDTEKEFSTRELWQRIAGTEPDPALRNKKSTSFYNCLKNLDDIIKDRALEDALYYDKTGDVISIEDPSFRFYLNFVEVDELRNAVRVRSGRFPWDVAVSFAGEHRQIVEEFREYLNSAGYSVFYDFDHQHILWGQNLREKLGDVYANEAEFMVIFLSEKYPEKDWPSFEFDVGKAARQKRTKEYLLPVILDDVQVVGISSDYGILDARRMSIEEIAKIMIEKLEAEPSNTVLNEGNASVIFN
jgi:hypothetical protein